MTLLLADLRLADLVIARDPFLLPASGVDSGVLPDDMVDHLRVATRFPVAPTVSGAAIPLAVIGGGRCVWAAEQAGWATPIRCVLRGPPPPGLATIPLDPNAADDGPRQILHSAAFDRALSHEERRVVEMRLADFALAMTRAGEPTLQDPAQGRWVRPDLLHLDACFPDRFSAPFARGLWEAFDDLRRGGLVLRAWDGRVLL